MPRGTPRYPKLIEDFVAADIPTAEVVTDKVIKGTTQSINRSIKTIGYDGLIKAINHDKKTYLVNLTLVEE